MKALTMALAVLFLAVAPASKAATQPVVSTVLNGASYDAVVAPGCWVAIFGSNLASAPVSAPSGSLPSLLGGVSVSVSGVAAPLLYVSPNQINALIPIGVAIPANTVVPLSITAPAGATTYNIRLTRDAPALFTRNGSGTGRAIVFDPNFQTVDTIGPRDVVVLYATGLGPTDNSGRVVDNVEVYIGERGAQVLYAGVAPGIPGVYQLNVVAPVPATDRLYIRSGGWQSNIVDIGIRGGANTANVSGTIDGLFPSSDPAFPTIPKPCVGDSDPGPCGPMGETSSLILQAGTFKVSFDVLPSASTFDVAAVSEAGGVIITIDPVAGTYTASVTTLTAAERAGNFSGFTGVLWNYSSCSWISAVCQQFPANTVPATMLTPFWARAVQVLPQPNTTVAGNPNASVQASAKLSGARFAIDDQNNTALSKFGGVVQVPYGPFPSRVSTLKLYVDGKLIGSTSLPYLAWYRGLAIYPDF
jgi:uncharacterized protein (TIGR03437 family)